MRGISGSERVEEADVEEEELVGELSVALGCSSVAGRTIASESLACRRARSASISALLSVVAALVAARVGGHIRFIHVIKKKLKYTYGHNRNLIVFWSGQNVTVLAVKMSPHNDNNSRNENVPSTRLLLIVASILRNHHSRAKFVLN